MAETFAHLLEVLKTEVLADENVNDVSNDNADLLPMLYRASSEIAATLGFPQEMVPVVVNSGDAVFILPADTQAVRVNGVQIGEFDLRPETMQGVVRKASFTDGNPAVYHFDPRRSPPSVSFAPPYSGGTTSAVLAVTTFINPRSLTPTDVPWEGAMPGWRWVITLLAGEKAMRSLGDLERANVFQQKYQVALAQFGKFLGLPADELTMPELRARMDSAAQPDRAWFPAHAVGGNQ